MTLPETATPGGIGRTRIPAITGGPAGSRRGSSRLGCGLDADVGNGDVEGLLERARPTSSCRLVAEEARLAIEPGRIRKMSGASHGGG